jgi:hypothetical protein
LLLLLLGGPSSIAASSGGCIAASSRSNGCGGVCESRRSEQMYDCGARERQHCKHPLQVVSRQVLLLLLLLWNL